MSAAPLFWNSVLSNTRSSPEGIFEFLRGVSALSLFRISSAVWLPLLIILGFDFFDHWYQKRLVRGLPLVQDGVCLSPCFRSQASTLDAHETLQASYNKYTKKGKAFAVKWDHPINTIVILPPQCRKEYASLPRDHASFTLAAFKTLKIIEIVDTDWTNKLAAIHAKNIAKLMSTELDEVLPLSLNASTDGWSSQNGLEAMSDIVNTLSSKLYFPLGFREHPDFKQAFNAWENALEAPFMQVYNYPEVIRPFLMRLLPTCRTYRSALEDLRKMMTPVIENQAKIMQRDKKFSETDGSMPFIKLLIEQELKKNPTQNVNAEHLANRSILIFEEAAAPVISLTTSMVFEIMRHQECIEPLRKELEAALQLSGDDWSFDIFKHTPKLESYTQEIFRLYPASSVSGSRYVMKPIKLPSLGITLQAGTYVTMPARYIQSDADNYANPMKFDAYRFYDESSNTCAGLKPSETFLTYGIGTSILLGYDMGPIDSNVAIQKYEAAGESFPAPEITITTRKRERRGPNRQTPDQEIVQ